METTPHKKRSNALYVIVIIVLVVLVVLLDVKRREALKTAQQVSVNAGDAGQAQNREAAMRIVADLRKLIDLPEGIEPTVATIVDVDELRKRNAFYNKAENGDYLIVTTDRAILYDADRNVILDVVPVQIQPAAANEQPAQ